MFGYIVRRLVAAFIVVVLASMIVFAIFFFGPINAAAAICNESGRCTQEKQAQLEESLGLNDPITTQYAEWVKGLFVGREITAGATYPCDAPCLGISYSTKQEVTQDLKDKFPATLSLVLGAAVVFLSVGVTVGVLAAKWRGTLSDKLVVSSTLVASSIPYVLVALLAWIYLTQVWNIFPETGYTPFTENPALWASGLLLPWLVLGLATSTQYSRFSRGAMVETLGEDYVRTAAAKGVSRNKVIFKHGLRAAIVPIITIFGLDLAALLAGALVTETIFEIDGIGNWALDALPNDFPVIAATVLVSAVFIVTSNLVVDIVYSFLDPRVRLV
jgi:peptide/nickel transport system permease protein